MKQYKIILLFLLVGCSLTQKVNAQKEVKEKLISVSAIITGEDGQPVANAVINAQEGKYTVKSDKNGNFTVQVPVNGEIMIEADGFESLITTVPALASKKVVLKANLLFFGKDDQTIVPFGELAKRRITGAVTEVRTDKMEDKYSGWNYASVLKSEGFGLIGSKNIRGTGSTIVVDGLVRDGNSSVETFSDLLNMSEIESITVLKDVTSRLLYGSLSDAGIIFITTKKGKAYEKKINIRYEGSVGTPIEFPKYLKAADYMTLYNEALKNDGITTPKYSNAEIDSTRYGVDPVRYPDQDYYNAAFLREVKPQQRIAAEFSGGNKIAQYYLNFGWYNTHSMQTMGEADMQSTNRFNVRGNVDIKVNDFIKVNLGTVAVFNAYHGANYKSLDYWGLSIKNRPNAYPFLIPTDRIIAADQQIVEDARAQKSVINNQLLGGSTQFTQNIYGDLLLGGYSNAMDRNAEVNIGIDVNLDRLLSGLKYRTYLGYDNYNAYEVSQNNTYAVYEPTFTAEDSISVKAVGTNNFVGSQSIGSVNFYRRFGWYNTLNYAKTFNSIHDLDITAMSLMSSYKQNNFTYTEKTSNFGLRANYMYNNKYIAELDGMFIGSPRFQKGHQWGFSPALGLGWIISEESFFKPIKAVDYLKLKASCGNTKTDNDNAFSNYYLYQNVYNVAGSFNYGDGVGGNDYLSVQTGNPNISWVERNELNVGVEASLFGKSLFSEINYFRSVRFNEIQTLTNTYPQFMGGSAFISYENYGKRIQQGFEVDLNYTKEYKDFRFNAGFNMIYVMPVRLVTDELDYGAGHEYRQWEGKANDAMWGLVSEGLYTQEEIDKINDVNDNTVAKPAFGTVQAGDIKYADIDKNGIVDENDTKMIGNTQARFNYVLNLTIDYKNFSLFAYGCAETGYYKMRNSAYDWVYGEMKYPEYITNRWAYDPDLNVDTRTTATYPRLTTKNNTNNFRNSTFWLTKRDYFSIPAIQLSYTVPWELSKKWFLKQFTLYARAENLWTISRDKYATLNVGSSPQLRMYNMGIKASF
ncbi:MAG: SusC/RagA family TonB-linked outer membrane protein [Bacteroidales bacterium]